MTNCAYLKDGPKAGELVPIDDAPGAIVFMVYRSIAEVMTSFDRIDYKPVQVDEYRHLGTVELYEYVGRK